MTRATHLAYHRDMRNNAIHFLLTILMIVGGYSKVIDAEQTSPPGKFSVADLQKLKWIEGTWRGTGDVVSPFFERYRFENETTLAVDSFTDETLTKVEDTSRFELKDGQFGNGGDGSRWAATTIDYLGVTFVPFAKAKNTFRWQRESDHLWTAVLQWPASDGKPARQRIYKMERWPK
jgi:hypothetical protein